MVGKCEYYDMHPNYAERGANRPRFCKDHKQPTMVDVKNIRCIYAECDKQPAYAEKGANRPRFGVTHKESTMVDVVNKWYEQDGCDKIPTYAKKGARPRICSAHKKPNMSDVASKRCAYTECDKHAVYAEKGAKRPRFCIAHKEPSMVNVKHKRCEQEGFEIIASHDFPGIEASSCGIHRSTGMIAYPRERCSFACCKSTGTHGKVDGTTTRFCEEHAPLDYIDIVYRNCSSCGLLDILRERLSADCDPVARLTFEHAKENRVRDVLTSRGFEYLTHDKLVDRGECVRYRPDFVFDAGTQFVVLEVDENQLMSYNYDCEQQRMVNLSHAMGMPTVFVRYNPDGDKARNGSRAARARAGGHSVRVVVTHAQAGI